MREPPSGITGELRDFLHDLVADLNRLPTISRFSGVTPNSIVSGLAGHLAVNVGSASTTSRVWIKGGSASVPSTTGWAVLRVLE